MMNQEYIQSPASCHPFTSFFNNKYANTYTDQPEALYRNKSKIAEQQVQIITNLIYHFILIKVMTDNKIVDFIAIPPSTTADTKNFLITTIRNACELYGDEQTAISRHIYDTFREKLGGDWFVIVCPKDDKTYNASFSTANNQNNESIRYYLTRENKMYLIVKYPSSS